MHYELKIELLSETIIGSGVSVPGSVDNDVIYNALGLPYIKGRTIKGNLRESFENVLDWLGADPTMAVKFFGTEGIYNSENGLLSISDGQLSRAVLQAITGAVSQQQVYIQEIKSALTNERHFTQIEEGMAKDHSLRSIRTIEPGLQLFADIHMNGVLTPYEEGVLAASVSMLKSIGLMRSRGKGEVRCSLYKQGEDITFTALNELEKGVV